jgi:hypothetical protein
VTARAFVAYTHFVKAKAPKKVREDQIGKDGWRQSGSGRKGRIKGKR